MISFMGTGAEGKKICHNLSFSECHQCFVKLEANGNLVKSGVQCFLSNGNSRTIAR